MTPMNSLEGWSWGEADRELPRMREPLRLLVTGSQTWPYRGVVENALRSAKHWVESTGSRLHVAHGACPAGADWYADAWCIWAEVVTRRYPVTSQDWQTKGRAAGPLRNKAMIEDFKPDLVYAFHHNASPGTRGCLDMAIAQGIAWARWTATDRLPGIVQYTDPQTPTPIHLPVVIGNRLIR